MKPEYPISDEQLNSLLDDELECDERALVLDAIQTDKEISARYCELRKLKDLVAFAYQDPPTPINTRHLSGSSVTSSWLRTAALSTVLLLSGGVGGWIVSTQLAVDRESAFQTIGEFNPETVTTGNVLLHIDSMDKTRINAVLDKSVRLLDLAKTNHNNSLELEIVANSEGLGLLRDGSIYADRIHDIVSHHDNVKFMACGIAKRTLALKEGKEIELIPEAQDIPAALDRILYRVKDGWTYVRG
jgi:hypothetical protein